MKILVIGKHSQLGKSLQKIILKNKKKDKYIFVGREQLNLENKLNILKYFKNNFFDIIINCAAYTEVDKAENNKKLVYKINNLAVSNLIQIANNQKAKLIQISTDYVFDGKKHKPYIETDKTNPINMYGKSKLAGEKAIKNINQTHAIIIRTSWLYSEYNNNFLKKILKLSEDRSLINVVSDQISSPTYAGDLAKAIIDIINNKEFKNEKNYTEIYHYSNEGYVSRYEFVKEVFKLLDKNCYIKPINTKQFKSLAKRPKKTLLDKRKIIKKFDLKIVSWKDSLKKCLKIIIPELN